MRSNYWSCSKFADWVRGSNKLKSGTSQQWYEWDEASKARHPVRFWIAEELLDMIQDTIYWPVDTLQNIKYWMVNRFISKTHALTSNLKRGAFHEFEDRVLHCMFDELVNFVEVEEAWHYIIWDKEAREKFEAPWWSFGRWRTRTWRNAAAGVAHLEWETTLKFDDDYHKKDDFYMEPTPQAIAAKETLELYNWWKNVRPLRADPYVISGWQAIDDKKKAEQGGRGLWLDDRFTPEEKIAHRAALDKVSEIEGQYQQEDDDMLIRLVKLRRNLWT